MLREIRSKDSVTNLTKNWSTKIYWHILNILKNIEIFISIIHFSIIYWNNKILIKNVAALNTTLKSYKGWTTSGNDKWISWFCPLSHDMDPGSGGTRVWVSGLPQWGQSQDGPAGAETLNTHFEQLCAGRLSSTEQSWSYSPAPSRRGLGDIAPLLEASGIVWMELWLHCGGAEPLILHPLSQGWKVLSSPNTPTLCTHVTATTKTIMY